MSKTARDFRDEAFQAAEKAGMEKELQSAFVIGFLSKTVEAQQAHLTEWEERFKILLKKQIL